MSDISWFSSCRFGMFIHFGIYSVPAGVWKGKKIKRRYSEWLQASERVGREEYKELAKQFNPTEFDADRWIGYCRDAGMKYFLITAKHHDGFALWPSKVSKYNVVDATPFKRDILAELSKACAKHDIKFGLYYSHWFDWDGTGGDIDPKFMEGGEYVHPTEQEFAYYWNNKCIPQVKELIEGYKPAFFWFDSWDDDHLDTYITPERQEELISLVKSMDGQCLVNSRIHFTNPSANVDYMSEMDNTFPDKGFEKPWETSGTLNDSWAYHVLDYKWKSTTELIKNLVGNASLGGNYQLNVGPTGKGLFQDAALKRIKEIGLWLGVNGESIYGTQASEFAPVPWGKITVRHLAENQMRVYLHLWDFLPGTEIILKAGAVKCVTGKVLETGQPVDVKICPDHLCIHLPEELKGVDLPVVCLDIDNTQ